MVTLTCAAAFTVLGVVSALVAGRWDFHFGVIRPISLLAIGYLIAYWGGQEIRLQEKLQLLQEVSNIWNPLWYGACHRDQPRSAGAVLRCAGLYTRAQAAIA